MENLLCFDFQYKILDRVTERIQAQGSLASGSASPFHDVSYTTPCIAQLKILIPGFNPTNWSTLVTIYASQASDSRPMQLYDNKKRSLFLQVIFR